MNRRAFLTRLTGVAVVLPALELPAVQTPAPAPVVPPPWTPPGLPDPPVYFLSGSATLPWEWVGMDEYGS